MQSERWFAYMDELLRQTAHRPYPLPDAPWLMTQMWENLLFMHWPVDCALVREHVPEELDLDTWEGQAWISIAPFQVKHQRFRILPEIPMLNEYLELNVRTYVKRIGKQGVWFFSLDADLTPAVFAAIGLLALPYKNAEMSFEAEGPGEDHDAEAFDNSGENALAGANFSKKKGFRFKNRRITGVDGFGRFDCSYRAVSGAGLCKAGTLEHWLVERYCLFATRDGKVLRGDIHHLPWDVSAAEAVVSVNTMCPVPLPGEPLLQFCGSKKVLMFPFVED